MKTALKRILIVIPALLLGLSTARSAAAAAPSCPQTNCCTSVWTTFLAVSGTTSGASQTGVVNGLNAWWSSVSTGDNDRNLGSCADSACDSFSFTINNASVGYYKIRAYVDNHQRDNACIIGIVGVNDTCEGTTTWWGQCGAPQASSGMSLAVWNSDNASGYNWDYVTWDKCNNPSGTNGNARVWYLTAGTYTLEIHAKDHNEYFNAIQLMANAAPPTPTPTFTFSPTITRSPTKTATPAGVPPTKTFTPTNSPTPTPLPTVWAGLPINMRPYGLEYVPFPTVTTGGNTMYGLDKTHTSSFDYPMNTARWHIVFQNLTSTSNSGDAAVPTNPFCVETRIGPYGVSCTTGVYDPTVYANATSLTLPSRPQNFSSAYFYITENSNDVPATEQLDVVGDPRFMPYADLLDCAGCGGTFGFDGFQGGYNWFFRDFSDGTGTYANDGNQDQYYKPFLPSASTGNNDHYNGQQNIDVPKDLQLIREGVMMSKAVYTGMSGYDTYYCGQGGEIGGDSSNNLTNGVPMFGGPWANSSNSYNIDEIVGGQNINGACYVVTGTSTGAISWWSVPMVGELWPDAMYHSMWSSNNSANTNWGNLNNSRESGSAFRIEHQNQANPYTNFLQTLHRNADWGCASFFNGSNNGSSTFNHEFAGFNASLLNDGLVMSSDYNFTLPSSFYVTRPWGVNDGGNTPTEATMSPYSGRQTHLDVFSADPVAQVPNTSWGFYADDGVALASVTNKSAAAVRAIDVSGGITPNNGNGDGNPSGGWFIMNGLAPSTQSGINFVAQFAILACLRTYQDAGVPTSAAGGIFGTFTNTNNIYNTQVYRIPPVPLVDIQHPAGSDNVAGLTTLNIQWNERYVRWDGHQYTSNYPCVDDNVGNCTSNDAFPNPAIEWHDAQTLGFNIIYNQPTGVSPTAWYSAMTGNIVPAGPGNNYQQGYPGQYMDGQDSIPYSTTYKYTQSWTNVAPDTYNIQVECFRLASSGVAMPHYAYHQVQVNTTP